MARANKHGSLHKVWEITALKRQPDHDKALAMLQRVAAHVRACDMPSVACNSLLASVGITVCGWLPTAGTTHHGEAEVAGGLSGRRRARAGGGAHNGDGAA